MLLKRDDAPQLRSRTVPEARDVAIQGRSGGRASKQAGVVDLTFGINHCLNGPAVTVASRFARDAVSVATDCVAWAPMVACNARTAPRTPWR